MFTSTVDPKESVQPFKDYTLREQEIVQKERRALHGIDLKVVNPVKASQRLPKRLRGQVVDLIQRLQRLHKRCSYQQLLEHYCPLKVSVPLSRIAHVTEIQNQRAQKSCQESTIAPSARSTSTQLIIQVSRPTPKVNAASTVTKPLAEATEPPLVSLATSHSDVSAFCRAVLLNIIPNGCWGDGEIGHKNKFLVMQNVDMFVNLRRFESISLHFVFQGMKVWQP